MDQAQYERSMGLKQAMYEAAKATIPSQVFAVPIPTPLLPQPAFASPVKEQKFFTVWRENGGTPTVKHPTLASAETEADRLARLEPGKKYFILSALESVTSPKPTATWKAAY